MRAWSGALTDLLSCREEAQVRDAAHRERRGLAAQDAGQCVTDADRADGAVALAGEQVAVEPAVAAERVAADAGFPGVLFLEVRAGVEGVANGLERDGLAFLEERREGGGAGVEAEEAVEINEAVRLAGLGERDALAELTVAGVLERGDKVEGRPCRRAGRWRRRGFVAAHREEVVGVEAHVGQKATRMDAAVGGSEGGGGLEEEAAGDVHGKEGCGMRRRMRRGDAGCGMRRGDALPKITAFLQQARSDVDGKRSRQG